SVDGFIKEGYLPEAIVNYLALVGWSPKSNEEILYMDELIEQFSFERVAKTGGIFDKEKLNRVNEHYIRGKTADEITDLCIPYLKEAGYITDEDVKNRYEWLKTMVTTVQENLSTTKDIVDKVDFFFNDKVVIEDDKALEVIEGEQVPELLNAFEEAV